MWKYETPSETTTKGLLMSISIKLMPYFAQLIGFNLSLSRFFWPSLMLLDGERL